LLRLRHIAWAAISYIHWYSVDESSGG
jgi:hypothetical protein